MAVMFLECETCGGPVHHELVVESAPLDLSGFQSDFQANESTSPGWLFVGPVASVMLWALVWYVARLVWVRLIS